MKGTNEELGKKMLAESGLPIISADTMAEAATRVAAVSKYCPTPRPFGLAAPKGRFSPGRPGGKSNSKDLQMSILINKDTKVITQGITGKTGQFHTRMCREYANGKAAFVAGVNPKKAGEDFEGVPIFASVKDAKADTGATVSVIYVPPAGAAAAIWEAVEAELDLVICITEGIPVRDMLEVKNRMKAKGSKTLLLGRTAPA